MAKKYAVTIQKGGQGKTRITINLGAALAQRGYKVLLIDLDAHGHLSEGLGLREEFDKGSGSVYDVIAKKNGNLTDLILHDTQENLYIIPSEQRMKQLPKILFQMRDGERQLERALRQIEDSYDFIFIDCPPKDDEVTDSAIVAARRVIIPVVPDTDAVRSLELTFDDIEELKAEMDIEVEITAIVPNYVDSNPDTEEILREMRENLPMVTPFDVRKRRIISVAWRAGRSVFTYEPEKASRKQALKDAQIYFSQLADFILNKQE